MIFIVTMALASVFVFTLSLCWAAKRGDEAMTHHYHHHHRHP